MSKHNKHKRKRKAVRPGVGPDMNVEMAQASHDLDARADFDWFERHPGVTKRLRAASPLEIAAFNLPPGSRMLAFRTPCGLQGRGIVLPEGSDKG